MPTALVQIGTAVGSGSLILDDAAEGLLDTAVLGDALGYVWADITAHLRAADGISINRGSTRNQGPYFRYEAGRASFVVDNRDGLFDPFNLAGTYVAGGKSLLRPGLPVRIQADYEGTIFTLFVGFVDAWDVSFPANAFDSIVDVTAYDSAGVFAAADQGAAGEQGAGENAGERINRVLDNIGWDEGLRNIEAGTTDALQPTTLAQPAWTEMLLTADSVNGYLFVDRFGAPTFQSRSNFPRTPTQFFGTGGNPIRNLKISSDADQVFNVIKFARTGGSVQVAQDAVSQAENRVRGYARSDLIVNSEDQVLGSANYVLSQHKDLVLRVEGFDPVLSDTSAAALWADMLRLDMLSRHSSSFITTDGRAIVDEGLVRGLALKITPFDWRWTISSAQAPDPLGSFTLDSVFDGILGTGVLAAF